MVRFTLFPAIDLRHGHVVRLQHGDPARQTSYSADPMAVGQQWKNAGARWLHVVNLDGAFAEAGGDNWARLPDLASLGLSIQFGGGLRTLADIERAFTQGVTRVILGTVAVTQPALVEQAVATFGAERILVALDARDGTVRTHGWQSKAAVSVTDLAGQMRTLGIGTVVHTDIGRDGVLSGVNVAASAELARQSKLAVIASGGVAGIEDIARAATYAGAGVTGLVIGRALYDGRLELSEALKFEKDPNGRV